MLLPPLPSISACAVTLISGASPVDSSGTLYKLTRTDDGSVEVSFSVSVTATEGTATGGTLEIRVPEHLFYSNGSSANRAFVDVAQLNVPAYESSLNLRTSALYYTIDESTNEYVIASYGEIDPSSLGKICVSYKVANLDQMAETLDALPFGASAKIKGDSSSNDVTVTSNQVALVCDTGQQPAVLAAAASAESEPVVSEDTVESEEASVEGGASETEEVVALTAAAPTLAATVGSTSADIITGKNGNLTASITADKESYAPGDTATFTVTLNNSTGSDFNPKVKNNENVIDLTPRLSDAALGALVGSIDPQSLTSQLSKNASTTFTFTVQIPIEAASSSGYFNVDLSLAGTLGKDFSSNMPQTISAPLTVVRPAGVIVTSATDAGSSLNGYNSSVSDEKLVASFGLFNWSNTDSSFTYALTVTGNKASGPDDITSKLTPSWEPAYLSADGTGTLAGDATENAVVDIPLGNFDPDQDYESFTVSLSVTDETGKTTTQSVLIDRPAKDLSSRTWDTVYRSGTSYKTVTITTEDFDNLYYGKVASDSRVPFSDAESFKRYLGHAKTEEEMQERFSRYIYDLFDPSPKGNKDDEDDYEDRILSWPKDSTGPFHAQVSSLIKDPEEYSLADAGVTYNNQYFSDLSKTVSPDLGDANTNREYEIDLSAKADPVAKVPVAYVFMIQTSWQMFDQKHAQAQKGDGTGTDVGSILTSVESEAYLYDIKNALIRFAEYLKANGDNTAAIAITNVQHGGSHSMFGPDSGSKKGGSGYFVTDADTLLAGLYGWDSFGDCEHVHYDVNMFSAAMASLPTDLANWKDADGVNIVGEAKKAAIVIGGPTENSSGTNGYGCVISGLSNIDYLYAIRNDVGTTQLYQNGKPIYSWLDMAANQSLLNTWSSHGKGGYLVATSEDAMFQALMDIYNNTGIIRNSSKYGQVDNATITDTVTKEFDVTGATATWTSVDGTTKTYTLSANPDIFKVDVHDDGTTKVTCNYGTLKGTGTVDLKINVKAKADYLGSNNVLTNVGTPSIDFSHTKSSTSATTEYHEDFTDKPQVNVPLLDIEATGGQDTDVVNTTFDLKDYAEASVKAALTSYEQTNGTVQFDWVEVDENGNEISSDISYTPTTCTITNGVLSGDYALPSCQVTSGTPTTRHFVLKATLTPTEATNGLKPVSGKTVTAPVDLTWTNNVFSLEITKRDADNQTTLLSGVEFELRKDDEDGTYSEESDALEGTPASTVDGVVSFANLTPGTYWIVETKTASGYSMLQSPLKLRITNDAAYLTSTDGSTEAPCTVTDHVIKIAIDNHKVGPLPLTGSTRSMLPVIAGIASLAFCAALLHASRRRSGKRAER